MTHIEIYTDGACKGNPGRGGWGALLRMQTSKGLHEKELFGGESNTTNNRMEVMAVIRALELIKRPCQVSVYTDSRYVQSGIRGFRIKKIKNVDLWLILNKLLLVHQVDCFWVKGHSGHEGNDRADALANLGVPEK